MGWNDWLAENPERDHPISCYPVHDREAALTEIGRTKLPECQH